MTAVQYDSLTRAAHALTTSEVLSDRALLHSTITDLMRLLLTQCELVVAVPSASTSSAPVSAPATRRFKLVEVELYLHHAVHHPDVFAHRHPEQLQYGRWYFHKLGNSFRGGTWKGLDLALGRPSPESGDTHCGVLIRSIKPCDGSDAIVEGPCLVVDELLRCTASRSIQELVDRWDGDTSALDSSTLSSRPSSIFLQQIPNVTASSSHDDPVPLRSFKRPKITSRFFTPDSSSTDLESGDSDALLQIHTSPRVGLALNPTDLDRRMQFIATPLRFMTHLSSLKKGRHCSVTSKLIPLVDTNSRTFAIPDKATIKQIAQATGATVAAVEGFAGSFKLGYERTADLRGSSLVKSKSPKDLAQIFGACLRYEDAVEE